LSGQLIEAQERERSRIARELHDDICQRLALLSMQIDRANRGFSGSPANLEQIQKHCSEIASDVQSLAHQLHSSKLDYLGITAALRGVCEECSKQHEVKIEFKERSVPNHLPRDIALCLFRVTQEALHNAVKHSFTRDFAVEVKGEADTVQLEVRDWGTGFDVEEAMRKRGLGLLSMQERVHLVHHGEGTVVVRAGRVERGDLVRGADQDRVVPVAPGFAAATRAAGEHEARDCRDRDEAEPHAGLLRNGIHSVLPLPVVCKRNARTRPDGPRGVSSQV